MNLEEITQEFWQASQKFYACRISMLGEPLPRTIHPYGIAKTSKNQIVLVCWQALGFTKAGAKEGFRNLLLENILEIETLTIHFEKRNDFNSLDGQYKEWVFHI
jgi:hypothetical protein